MKINWKERFKNKAWVTIFVLQTIAIIYFALSLFGITPKISEESWKTFALMIICMAGDLGILTDPTTPGINDSQRAMTYGTNYDIRFTEEASESDEGERKATSNGNV